MKDKEQTMTNQEVDLVLLGGTAITVDSERRVIRDAGIAIQGEDIAFVGKAAEVSERYLAKRAIDCKDKVIIPGMVNAHVHYSHHLSKGMVPDNLGGALFSNFLHSTITPNLTVEDEKMGAKALLLEMLKGGTTMFLEAGSIYPFEIMRSEIQDIGIKGVMGRRCFDLETFGHGSERKGQSMETTDEILKINERFLKEFIKEKLPIRPIVTIVGMSRFTDRLAVESKKMADRYGVHLKMHLANKHEYVLFTQARTGLRPVEHLEKLGILDQNVILVHMTYVTQKEVDILAKRGTKVVHCPAVALKLATGLHLGRFPEMLHAGIPVALGTDCSDCANSHDMIRTMFLAAVVYKDMRLDPELMGAETAIEMATINGAKAIGMENEIGSLEAGKKADIVIFDTNRLEWRPLYNEVQTLVYSANADMVESVIINGRFVMEKRKILTVDEEEILDGIRLSEKELKARLNIPGTSPKWEFV
jgi:cytosine/adenosine deaminase-related metal-dependent hydrolase